MAAFASAWTPALSTTTRPRSTLAGTAVVPSRGVAATAATTMRFGVDMDKYANMARDTLGLNAKPVDYSRPSAFWKNTTATQAARNAPTVTVHHRVASAGSFDAYMDAWRGLITRTMAPAAVPATGVAPRGLAGARADVYMAERVRSAYKQQANPMGVVRWRPVERQVAPPTFLFFVVRSLAPLEDLRACSCEHGKLTVH